MTTPLRIQVDLPFTGEASLPNGKPIVKVTYSVWGGEYLEIGIVAAVYSADHDNETLEVGDPNYSEIPAAPDWFLKVAREMGAI